MEPSDGAAVASLTRDDLAPPPGVERSSLRRRLLILAAAILVAIAVITLVPGLASLRARFVLILGEEEIQRGVMTLKRMSDGSQATVRLDELDRRLGEMARA